MIIGLVTFGGKQASNQGIIETFYQTVREMLEFTDHIYVVDDGTDKIHKLASSQQITLTALPKCLGKSNAVRTALKVALKHKVPPDTIFLLTDYDRDVVISSAAKPLLSAIRNGVDVAIGNRHATHPENQYRSAVNLLQQAIGKQVGLNGATDSVSGTWAFTRKFAEQFLPLSHSEGWGINTEMFILAGLLGAKVVSVPLPETRNRSGTTDRLKIINIMDSILIHDVAMKKRGLGKLVEFLLQIRHKLNEKQECFEVDLRLLGINKTLIAVLLPDGDQFTLREL